MKYNLPKQTGDIINASQWCTNLRLLLDKYVPTEVIDKDEATDKRKDSRGTWLRNVVLNYEMSQKGNTELANAAYHRWYSYTSALQALHFSEVIDWRMVVGLGGNTILETDVTLQHLYGIPIIPGSALKGLTRAYAASEDKDVYIEDATGKRLPSKKLETDHKVLQSIFGTTDQAGTVIFFDAVPKGGQADIVLDIMNPHYPKYYQSQEAPTNDQNPVPIPFLTVTKTPFIFALAPRNPKDSIHTADLKKAYKWLRFALEQYGIGGKTSAGYGYFTKFEEQPRLPKESYVSKEAKPQMPEPYERPNIPIFREGQKIMGTVTDTKKDPEAAKYMESGEASACLKYKDRSFPTKKLLILIPAEYSVAKDWSAGNTKNCYFIREEVQGGCTVLVCRP